MKCLIMMFDFLILFFFLHVFMISKCPCVCFFHFCFPLSGKLKPTTAFMTGKLKLEGDMGKAMKLEKLMGKMQTKSFHTMPNHQRGKL